MKNRTVEFLNGILQRESFKDAVSKFLYRYLNYRMRSCPDVCFLNYGFESQNGDRPALDAGDEANRIYIQLYHHVVARSKPEDSDVVEISSGRGGGARYIKHYLKARSVCGIDRQPRAVRFCETQHGQPGLSFACGDAQRLPLPDASCDVVVNIEASHDYMDLERFLAEVDRVLRPGGHLCYTDFRDAQDVDDWRRRIEASPLEMVEEEDITPNVLDGLAANTEHNLELVRKLSPRPLRPVFRQFSGVKGTCIYERFETGRSKYIRFLLRKRVR